jgi:small multidrug resistance pump
VHPGVGFKDAHSIDSMPPRQGWILVLAILAEVLATSALKASNGFTRPAPSLIVIIGYIVAFYCLSLSLRTIPLGIVYAVWSGSGVALISLIGWLVYGQVLDLAAVVGLAMIVAGVIVLNLGSMASH